MTRGLPQDLMSGLSGLGLIYAHVVDDFSLASLDTFPLKYNTILTLITVSLFSFHR
jgi:hypothetical protein